jgi:predicted GNAT family acetyltransferase
MEHPPQEHRSNPNRLYISRDRGALVLCGRPYYLVRMATGVRDNITQRRFELDLDGSTAFATYRQSDGIVSIFHTEVPHELNGKGYGSDLVRGTLDLIRSRGQKVRPMCPFVSFFIREHPEYADLLA